MYCIGIDIGTNSTRAALVSAKGQLISVASCAYPIAYPQKGYAEQRAEDWWSTVVQTVRQVLPANPGEVVALSFSAQGGSTVAVDENYRPLGPAITWLDMRAQAQADALCGRYDPEEWRRCTGVVPSPSYTLSQIVWMREHTPDVFAKASRFVTTLDFINGCLTGNCVIDPTSALMTGMLNQQTADWYDRALDAIGIARERLAQMQPTGALVGKLTTEAAEALGLSTSVCVYNGAHDQYACAVGCGAIHNGDSMLSCGTAWVLLAAMRERLPDSQHLLTQGFHAVPAMRGAFYSLSAGGQVLNWTMAQTGQGNRFTHMNQVAAARIEQNSGLFFYPYLAGAVGLDSPHATRGTITGLELSTDAYDLALAAMEGVAFETARAVNAVRNCGTEISQIRMMGGAAKSDLWTDILAAVTGLPVIRPTQSESALMGAARIALVGHGVFSGYEAVCRESDDTAYVVHPDQKFANFYRDKHARYLSGHKLALSLGNLN